MSQQPNVFLFSSILGAVFILLDVYVLAHWRAYVRKHSLNRWLNRIPWIVAAVMFGFYWFVVLRRHFFRLDGLEVILFGAVTFWYLPKIGIAPVLLVRDFIRLVRQVTWARNGNDVKTTLGVDTLSGAEPGADVVPSRREFIGRASWTLAAVPYAIVGNGMWRTVYDFQTVPVELTIPNLDSAFDGMTIVQLSDLHAGSFPDEKPFEEVVRIVDGLRPDMVVITGDFVNAKPNELGIIAKPLRKLEAPLGVFGSLGNHDHYNSIREHATLVRDITALGVNLLVNQHHRVRMGAGELIIAGTDNTGFKQNYARLDRALHQVGGTAPTILLAHDPTYWDKAIVGQAPVDVVMSGHTHGGQFGIQMLGFEWSPAQYVYKQWAGLYRAGEQQLYVNRGIGTVGPPLRIGIPPEITVFTLRAPRAVDRLA